WNGGKEEESGGWSKEHDKPSGGVHTGGGALATPSATAAGLGVLAVAGTGLYALRRKKTAGSVA
ncbi:LPXTG cell wall anchor domain-containing protein, partial [Streptomyces cacaoi]|uniref:LPXTG cell wall anchor domain-containing protein n=2 Tax=Streptomyces TaxID=1883 RepID=UPI0037485D8B